MRLIMMLGLAGAVLAVAPAYAQSSEGTPIEAGDWLVRLRGIMVSPTEKSGPVQPSFPGSSVGVSDSFMPEVDFTYMVTPHIGAELIVSSTKHKVTGRGTLSGLGEAASTWVLPPTLTLQYHPVAAGHVRPYVGAGVNYTIFYESKASDALQAAVGPTKVHMDDSFGYALQAGVDIDVTDKVFLNLDLKYIDIDTTARLRTGAAINTTRVHIDPLVAGVGVGMRF